MLAEDLIKELGKVDPKSEVIVVVYTDDGYEAGTIDRIDPNVRYNSVTKQKLGDSEKVVEITTTTGVIQ